MKILIANWVYNWGSTGFIVRDIMTEMTKLGHNVVIATGLKYGEDDSRVHIVATPREKKWFWRLSRIGFPKFSGSIKATKRLINLIEEKKPDVVNLHLLHCSTLNLYFLLEYLGKHNIKTVVTNHAELYFTGSCGYAYECDRWKECMCKGCPDTKEATGAYLFGNAHRNWLLMRKAFSFFKPNNLLFTAVSPWTKERMLQSPITNNFSCVVTMNGLNIDIFQKCDNITAVLDRFGDNKPYVVWVTANFNPENKNDVKGGWYFVELARLLPEQRFVAVSTNSSNIEDLPSNIVMWGKAKSQKELAQLYSGAVLTVLVSRRETFSMVTAESLCCGTPVVGFKAGGPETIAIPKYSRFVEQADTAALAEAVKYMSKQDFDRILISKEARVKYCSKTMAQQYLKAYESVLKD